MEGDSRTRLGRFLGRDQVRSRLQAALEAHGLVTVIGPPGIGKSRLVRAVLPEGTRVFDLDGVLEEEALRRLIGRAVGVRRPAALALRGLARRLGPGTIFFDNAEGVARPLSRLVEALVLEHPDIRIVVSSRERLLMPDEWLVEVPPLELADARALFLARCPGPIVGSTDDRDLDALLLALDRLPLAIELAAARAHLLPVAELRARLDQRFEWLARRGSGPGRHESLEGALRWSLERLEPRALEALATLSLFAAPAPLSWVIAALPWSETETLEVLSLLRDRSLLVVGPEGYGLLETVRAFVRRTPWSSERLERWLLAIVEPARAILAAHQRRGPEALAPLLGAAASNLSRAVDLALTHERLAVIVPLVLAEARVLEAAGQGPRVVARLEGLLPRLSPTLDERARLLTIIADARGSQGQADEAVLRLEEAVQLLESGPSDPALLAETRVLLAVRCRQRGELPRAIALASAGLAAVHGTRQRAEAMAAVNLGLILTHADRLSEARLSNERALDCFRSLEDHWGEALALANLGELAQLEGDLPRAAEHLGRAVQLLQEVVHDPRYAAVYSYVLGTVRHEQGQRAEAAALYQTALAGVAETHVPHMAALARGAWAALLAGEGRDALAEAELAEADRLLAQAPHPELREALRLHRGWTLGAEARAQILALPSPIATPAVRFARRLLERGGRPRLSVSADGRRLVLDGQSLDLSRRGPLARIVAVLAAASPAALRRDALIEAGWPGEQISPEAASTRLRVAITTLRKLGLSTALVTRDDGYLFDAHVELLSGE